MAIPEGYEKLAVIGIAYKGEYNPDTVYGMLNAVYYDGSTYVALRDNPTGTPVPDGVNWQYMAKGFMEGVLSAIDATDTSGLIGEPGAVVDAQDLLDVIADKVANKLVAKAQLVNNGLTTEEGFALDARYGKTLADGIAQTNSKWNSLGTYPMKYLGEDIPDVNLIPDGCTWCITGSSTANKPLGWTAARIIIVSFMISDYRLQFAGNQSTGKFAVRISPGGWVEK